MIETKQSPGASFLFFWNLHIKVSQIAAFKQIICQLVADHFQYEEENAQLNITDTFISNILYYKYPNQVIL